MNWKVNPKDNITTLTTCVLRVCKKKGPSGDCIANICYGGRFCFMNFSSQDFFMNWKSEPKENITLFTTCIVRICKKRGPTGDCIINICTSGRYCNKNSSN